VPAMMRSNILRESKAAKGRVIQEVMKPESDTARVEETIKHDPALPEIYASSLTWADELVP
ncbi:MAG: hypothetical protein ACYTGH_21740, partial [Planctomycetota bacterium]